MVATVRTARNLVILASATISPNTKLSAMTVRVSSTLISAPRKRSGRYSPALLKLKSVKIPFIPPSSSARRRQHGFDQIAGIGGEPLEHLRARLEWIGPGPLPFDQPGSQELHGVDKVVVGVGVRAVDLDLAVHD